MSSLQEEINDLQGQGLLPKAGYLSGTRFTTPYKNIKELGIGIATPVVWPIMNGLTSIYYAMRTVWATLRAVGNLLICKPGDAVKALNDASTRLSLTIALLVMAPIHALTSAIELLTRTVSCWFGAAEPVDDLSKFSLGEKFFAEEGKVSDLLPSKKYLSNAKFFSPYKNVFSFLNGLGSPLTVLVRSGFHSLSHALNAVNDAIHCIANIAICKPKHANESARDLGVHLSLSISLAAMAPINTLVKAIAFMTRLGTTWVDACGIMSEKEMEISTPSPSYT